jgi:hypothetical protein
MISTDKNRAKHVATCKRYVMRFKMPFIFKYITRKRKGNVTKVGVIVTYKKNGKVHFGWSLCKFKAGDVFDKWVGLVYALKRAKEVECIPTVPGIFCKVDAVPQSMAERADNWITHALKWFQDKPKAKKKLVKKKK